MQKSKSTTRYASWLLSGSLLTASCTFVSCSRDEIAPGNSAITASTAIGDSRANNLIPGQYIVVLKDNAVATAATDS